MAGKKAYHLEAANLPGRKYMEDKPKDCAYCYWWMPGKRCCEREECFYLLPPDIEPPGKYAAADMQGNCEEGAFDSITADTYGDCRDCPYGKHAPCIGFCLAKILHEMGERDE